MIQPFPPPLLPPSLHSSELLVSRKDVINHVDTLLVFILRVPSFSLSLCLPLLFIYLRLPQCLSISHTQFEGLINHLFTEKTSVMHTSGIIPWLAFLVSCTLCSTAPLLSFCVCVFNLIFFLLRLSSAHSYASQHKYDNHSQQTCPLVRLYF